ncbi:hypothetical protein ACYJ2U_001647 [Clostridium botulinum]
MCNDKHTYLTWRMIMEITENPYLEFKNQSGWTVKNKNGYIKFYEFGEETSNVDLKTNESWEIIEKPVDFKVVLNTDKKVKVKHYLVENDPFFTKYHTLKKILHNGFSRDYSDGFMRKVIAEGEWYIDPIL